MEKLLYTVAETCEILGVSKPTLYAMTRIPDFPAIHVGVQGTGRKILISAEGLQQWIKDHIEQRK